MYTANDFHADLKNLSTKNSSQKALNRLNRINKKVRETIRYYGFEAGKPYSQKERDVLIVHYPVIVGDVDSDENWDKIYKDVSFDIAGLLEENNLEDDWGFEGQEISKKSPKDTIDVLVYLK